MILSLLVASVLALVAYAAPIEVIVTESERSVQSPFKTGLTDKSSECAQFKHLVTDRMYAELLSEQCAKTLTPVPVNPVPATPLQDRISNYADDSLRLFRAPRWPTHPKVKVVLSANGQKHA
ncbi:hypothetical protein BD779DRAFT_1801387 [Infundibulicybe gibba]|nr:hypothetical protein BD779DRAFT_1801387 [Infundibulicybe gibba]